MIKNIFICNIYDPRKEDFDKIFFKNLTDNNNKTVEEYKTNFYKNLQKVTIGDPIATKKYTVEQLKEKNIVGLYTTEQTPLNFFNTIFFDPKLTKRTKKIEKNNIQCDYDELIDEFFDEGEKINDLLVEIDI